MRTMRRYKLWIYALVCWIPCASVLRFVAADEAARNPSVLAAHLVGHEDSALLLRIQDVIDDWDPRRLVNPYVETTISRGADGRSVVRKQLKRPDLEEFIADVAAAEALGKMLFWEMQAGSDFRRLANGRFAGTACASCHYRFGADARNRHTMRIPLVAWNKYPLAAAPWETTPALGFGEVQQEFNVRKQATQVVPYDQLAGRSPFSTIVGSQGVEPREFDGLNGDKPPRNGSVVWESEKSKPWTSDDVVDDHAMFIETVQVQGKEKKFPYRQVTARNAPSVINSGFADRLFHDVRAESTFNGFSIFGDVDKREVIHRRALDGSRRPIPVMVAITHAALASQAVGPIVNEVEMSYRGRTFADLARKLLDAHPLKYQEVDDDDSVLGEWLPKWSGPQATHTYRELIQKAFRREWWDGGAGGDMQDVPLELTRRWHDPTAGKRAAEKWAQSDDGTEVRLGTLMEANFSLYWGLSLLIYQSTLVSNETPFDAMMRGDPGPVNARFQAENGKQGFLGVPLDRKQTRQPPPQGTPAPVHTNGASLFQHGLRTFLRVGCVECHSGPLFSEIYTRLPEREALPIHYQMERILLPNSRGDAIAIQKQKQLTAVMDDVANQLAAWNPDTKSHAQRLAVDFELLREKAHGDQTRLKTEIEAVLVRIKRDGAAKVAHAIATTLMTFEKNAVHGFGERPFFTEEERVTMAEKMGAKVLVERMRIRPEQVPFRPSLPIHGALALRPYQFYDGGVYALGVSLPRYDSGVGAAQRLSKDSDPALIFDAAVGDKQNDARETPGRKKSPSVPRASGGAAGSAYQLQRVGKNADLKVRGAAVSKAMYSDVDRSWDRSGFPDNERRADQLFLSRTRQLVSDESRWGYRKPLLHDNETAFFGSFKTPSLRNVELTAPYMHNGRFMTLRNVIQFYDRDEDDDEGLALPRDKYRNPDMHPALVPLDMTDADKLALLFFLLCLTDDRVVHESGPFDHPSLNVVNGYASDAGAPDLSEVIFHVPPAGSCGRANNKLPSRFPAEQ